MYILCHLLPVTDCIISSFVVTWYYTIYYYYVARSFGECPGRWPSWDRRRRRTSGLPMKSAPLTRPMGRDSQTTTTASKTWSRVKEIYTWWWFECMCMCLCSVVKAKDLYHEAKLNRGELNEYLCIFSDVSCSMYCTCTCTLAKPYPPHQAINYCLMRLSISRGG